MDDRQNSIHEIHFDSSFKDHIGRVTGSIRWEKGQIIADTDTFGKIAIRRLQESDRKLFGNDAPPENSSVMAMAKFFFGEED
jgi:hypothetical protein